MIKLTTVVVIVGILIFGIYALTEVAFYSFEADEKNISSPVVLAPSIGLNERINNVSLSHGVMIDEVSRLPTQGEVVIHGHRTGFGSPFLRLNELNPGDTITLEWPGIGQVNYTVKNSTIVSPSHTIPVSNETQRVFLITCDPPGFAWNRLIITADMNMDEVGLLNDNIANENQNNIIALIICLLFLGVGLVLSYFYPIKEDRLVLLIVVLIVSGILFYTYFAPVDPGTFEPVINFINGDFSI